MTTTLATPVAAAEYGSRAPRRIVLCLDGTWNSAFGEHTRVDGHKVLRPTNPLKLCRAVLPRDEASRRDQLTYYDIGVGSLAEYPGPSNRLLRFSDRFLGGAWGAGFEGNVEDALHFLVLNFEPGDEVFVFGFSRGAATARAVTRFLEWNHGLPAKDDAYYLPIFFREYVTTHGAADAYEAKLKQINADRAKEKNERSRRPLAPFRPVEVKFLGVWDTVAALGGRFQATGESTSAPGRSFYAGKAPAAIVRHARQALAIDEARFDFRPEVWVEHAAGQTIEQRWFAGVHSNVGGGYPVDGLANIALKWIVAGAVKEGLKMDDNYLSFFPAIPTSALYDSSSTLYRVLDVVRLRKGKGRRPITGVNADLDRSVIERIAAKPSDLFLNASNQPYRPENVLQFLACQSDLDAYLRRISDNELTVQSIPADALQRIDQLRPRCK